MSQYMEAWTNSWQFAADIFNTMAANTLDLYITKSSEALKVLTFAIHNSWSSARKDFTMIEIENIFSRILKISQHLKS